MTPKYQNSRNEFRKRIKRLEDLADEGMLRCLKHNIDISRGYLYIKKCYIRRGPPYNTCPYLHIKKDKKSRRRQNGEN